MGIWKCNVLSALYLLIDSAHKMTIHGGLHGSGIVDDDELVSLGVPGTSIDGHVLQNELEGVDIRPS